MSGIETKHKIAIAVVAAIVIIAIFAQHMRRKSDKGKFCGTWDPASVAEAQALKTMGSV